jgi:hypothetical protein
MNNYPFELLLDERIVLEPKQNFVNRQEQKGRWFLWETHDGERMLLTKMATGHIFNAFRMLFNHTVPPAFRVGEFVRRGDVPFWPMNYITQAMAAFRVEFLSRDDIEPWMKHEMDDMHKNAEHLIIFGQIAAHVGGETAVQSMTGNAPPIDFEGTATMRDMRFSRRKPRKRATKTKNHPLDWRRPNRVRRYVRANGNKVKGYYRR